MAERVDDDVIVSVEQVSKKYCRSLRRSMWYGLVDSARDLIARSSHSDRLRAKEFWAVDGVSFEVGRGQALGVVGPNGAGKSTLLMMLHGIVRPDAGRIRIRGRAAPLIGVGAGFHPQLTGRENIYVNAAILGLSKGETDEVFDEIVEFADIGDYLDSPVKFYSSGMYVRLGFSVAVHVRPDVLLVDEVLSVGDVSFQSRCFNRIAEMRENGTAIILVSHNMHHVASFCDRVLYMRHGQPQCLGPPGESLAFYTRDMMKRRTGEVVEDGADLSEVNGTGRMVIRDVSFLDDDGREVSSLRSGDPLTIQVDYTSDGSVKNPMLDLVIRNSSPGNWFQATNRDFGVELGEIAPAGQIRVRIPSLNANNELLSFFFTLWDTDHREQFDWKRHFKLRVEGNAESSGRVLFDCEWENVPTEEGGARNVRAGSSVAG